MLLGRPRPQHRAWVPLAILLWGVVGGRCDPAMYTATEVEAFMAVCPQLAPSASESPPLPPVVKPAVRSCLLVAHVGPRYDICLWSAGLSKRLHWGVIGFLLVDCCLCETLSACDCFSQDHRTGVGVEFARRLMVARVKLVTPAIRPASFSTHCGYSHGSTPIPIWPAGGARHHAAGAAQSPGQRRHHRLLLLQLRAERAGLRPSACTHTAPMRAALATPS